MVIKIKEKISKLTESFLGARPNSPSVKSGISSLIINVSNKAIILMTGIVLIRILGKSQYGVYTYVLSILGVLAIPAEYGIANLLVRETAKGISNRDYPTIKGSWRWSLYFSLIFSAAILLLSFFGVLLGKNHFDQVEINTFIIAMALLPLHIIVFIGSGALRGLKKIIIGQLPDSIIIPGIFVLLLIAGYYLTPLELTASSTMALRLVATFVAFLCVMIFLFKNFPPKVKDVKPYYQGKAWLASVISLGLSSGLNIVKSRSNTLILGIFVDSGQIATFQVAVSAAALSGVILQAANVILAPQFASLISQKNFKKLQTLVSTSARIVSALTLAATIILVLFGKPLLAFAFGPDLVEAYPSLVILMGGQLVNAFLGSVAYILNMAGYEKDVMKAIGISAVINTVLALVLTPIWGIIGGAVASSISLIVAQVSLYRLVYKKLGIISHAFGRIAE